MLENKKLNSELYLNIYSGIEKYLRKITGKGKEVTFSILIKEAVNNNYAVKHFENNIKEIHDLRNAIVHERTDGHVIAEPNDLVVKEIELIAESLLRPPKVIPLFNFKVLSLFSSDPIAKAASSMLDKLYSQIPIYKGKKFLGLLTTNTITRWLGACVSEDIFSLNDTLIQDVLRYAEDEENYVFFSRENTVFDVLEEFKKHERKGKRLDAILITHNGKINESLLGIITIWDLPKIYERIKTFNDSNLIFN